MSQTPVKHRYLEVTFRQGKPIAAYLYLPRQAGDLSVRTRRFEPGLMVDYAADGRAIGVEMTALSRISIDLLNRVLGEAHQSPVSAEDIAPLKAA